MPEYSGTASRAVDDLLAVPDQPVRVLAVFRSAVYVEVVGTPRVVAVVTRHGVALPNAVVVDGDDWIATLEPPGGGREVAAGEAVIGDGRVTLGTVRIVADRRWDPRPRLDATDAHDFQLRLAALEAAVPASDGAHAAALDSGVAHLAEALTDLDAAAALEAAVDLVGLGPGLTPSGDDVLSGALAAGRAAARARRDVARDAWLADLGAQVAAIAPGRTTTLSASLLWHAARGEMAQPARHVVRALGGSTPLRPAVDALLAVGHSSGRDLAAGLVLGLRAGGGNHRAVLARDAGQRDILITPRSERR